MQIHQQINILKAAYPNVPHEVLSFAAGLQIAFRNVPPDTRYTPAAIAKGIELALDAYEETHS